MKKILYTIGYAHHTQESLLELLLKYHINCIIDVRTVPYSSFHAQFNKEVIKGYLKSSGILYIHMDKAFGIIKDKDELLNEEGYIDFTKIAKTPAFLEGVKRVEDGIAKGYTIGFMCAEKDPTHCHRSTLVGRAFYERGYDVQHILNGGALESHRQMIERMKEAFTLEDNQLHLFEAPKEEGQQIEEAYAACSKEIFIVNAKRVLKEQYDFPRDKR